MQIFVEGGGVPCELELETRAECNMQMFDHQGFCNYFPGRF